MVKGEKNKIIPVFDRENNAFEAYDSIDISSFSTDLSEYFSGGLGGNSYAFELECYLDILIAPFYVVSKINNETFSYSTKLKDLFFKLFLSSRDLSDSLHKGFSNIQPYLSSLQEECNNKKKLLISLSKLKERVNLIIRKLESVSHQYNNYDFVASALYHLPKIQELLKDYEEKILLTPEGQFVFNYYKKHLHISWIENPLSFFINVIYENGLDSIIFTRESESSAHGDVDNLHNYIDRIFRKEYAISLRLITQKIRSVAPQKKQDYINELCSQLSTLFNKSLSHPIKPLYDDHLRPYQSIARSLKNQFRKYTFPIGFSCQIEYDLLPIQERSFLRKLLSLEIPNIERELLPLCDPLITVTQLSYFLLGDLEPIPTVQFKWPPGTLYYLLIKLLENQASFSPADIAASGKFFMEHGGLFKSGNFYKYKSDLKKNEEGKPFHHELIDNLFR